MVEDEDVVISHKAAVGKQEIVGSAQVFVVFQEAEQVVTEIADDRALLYRTTKVIDRGKRIFSFQPQHGPRIPRQNRITALIFIGLRRIQKRKVILLVKRRCDLVRRAGHTASVWNFDPLTQVDVWIILREPMHRVLALLFATLLFSESLALTAAPPRPESALMLLPSAWQELGYEIVFLPPQAGYRAMTFPAKH